MKKKTFSPSKEKKRSASPSPSKKSSDRAKRSPTAKKRTVIVSPSSFSPQTSTVFPMSKKLHIVLDLDATFIDTVMNEPNSNFKDNIKNIETKILENKNISELNKYKFKERFHRFRSSTGSSVEGYTILRPGTYKFLDFAQHFFKNVSVWTAGTKQYADIITNILFPYQKPDIIFSMEECIKGNDTIQMLLNNENMILYNGEHYHNNQDVNNNSSQHLAPSPSNDDDRYMEFSKALLRVKQREFENLGVSIKNENPKKLAEYLKDIILLDDRDDTSQFNKNNLIQIPRFEIPDKITQKELLKDDDALLKLQKFFEKMPVVEDIRVYLKEKRDTIF